MLKAAVVSSTPALWRIDQQRSSIEFRVPYLTFSSVTGRFRRFEGTIHADPDDPAGGWAEVAIDPGSIDTGNPDRDRSLRESGFFEVSRFPECFYSARRLQRLQQSGPGFFRMIGDLTLHGVKRELELDLRVGPPRVEGGVRRVRYTASGRIDRKVFGVDWNPRFDFVPVFIGHWVDLKIEVEAVEQ